MTSPTTLQYHKHLRDRLNKIQPVLRLEEDHYYTAGAPNHYLIQFHSLNGRHIKELQQLGDILVIEPTKEGNLRLLIEVRSNDWV